MKTWFYLKAAKTVDPYIGYSGRHIHKQRRRLNGTRIALDVKAEKLGDAFVSTYTALHFKKDLVNISDHYERMYYAVHQYHQSLYTLLHKQSKTPCFAYRK
jgi:hypothetical protein